MKIGRNKFSRLCVKHLNYALKHTHAVPSEQPRPTHKLAKVLALMIWAVPCWTDADCTAVLRRLIGLEGPKPRPSLLLQGDVLERIEGGCLAKDDQRDAKKYRDEEHMKVVGVRLTCLSW